MSFMCPKEDELLRDFFPIKQETMGSWNVLFLNQVKCYVFLFFSFSLLDILSKNYHWIWIII